MIRATGCARRSEDTTRHFLEARRYTAPISREVASILQLLAVLHNQCSKPSCEGQGHGQGIESIVGGARVSCVRLWEDAKRLQGDARNPEEGTLGEYVIEAMQRMGWQDYEEGEDERDESLDSDGRIADTLEDALDGWSRRKRVVIHKTLDLWGYPIETVRAQLVEALRTPDTYLTLEGGCTERYFDPPANTVLGTEYRAGDSNGHCERIVGYDAKRDAAIIQGSWGSWTWCTGPDGHRLEGCSLVSMDVLRKAWAVDVVTLRAP